MEYFEEMQTHLKTYNGDWLDILNMSKKFHIDKLPKILMEGLEAMDAGVLKFPVYLWADKEQGRLFYLNDIEIKACLVSRVGDGEIPLFLCFEQNKEVKFIEYSVDQGHELHKYIRAMSLTAAIMEAKRSFDKDLN